MNLGPSIILLRADDELHLVAWLEAGDVIGEHFFGLAAARAFPVHDVAHARIARADVVRATGLDQHGEAHVAKAAHQRVNIFLQQRFAAGELNERQFVAGLAGEGASFFEFGDNLVDDHRLAAGESVRGVAVGAAEVAAGEPDEGARQPGEGALALNAQVDFVNQQRVGHGYASARFVQRLALIQMPRVNASRSIFSLGEWRLSSGSARPSR